MTAVPGLRTLRDAADHIQKLPKFADVSGRMVAADGLGHHAVSDEPPGEPAGFFAASPSDSSVELTRPSPTV